MTSGLASSVTTSTVTSTAKPYAELHCHSNFSFLDGASFPEEIVEEAARLGLEAVALTDHDGFYGVVRFAEAAREFGMLTVFGAELTLGRTRPPLGDADPGVRDGNSERHLIVLARGPRGYTLLARAISEAQMRGEKGAPRVSLADLGLLAGMDAPAGDRDCWAVLTACRKGAVSQALVEHGPAAASRELGQLIKVFGRHNVFVELWDHGDPLDSARNDMLVEIALRVGAQPVATNNVHYATPRRRQLAQALAAVRARRSLDELEGWIPASSGAHLRSGAEQARRFTRYPGVVARAAELGRSCAFDLALVAPNLPPFTCPPGYTEISWLRELAEQGARDLYGPRDHERVPGAYAQIDRELAMIEGLGFPGYFLVVWDLVSFCRRSDIYCQGRGSAANSAVCYVLGITKADAVSLGLLFERFLSPERDGPPDIDIDIESGRREEVIQYVYETHGRQHAAQVANVITYRKRSSVRDMAKALGYATGQQDAWSKQTDNAMTAEIPADVLSLASEVEHFPRHLGIHSGGMVICDRPVLEVCPVEWGRMEGRTVLQWDKDDCATAGLVKFDLLGLGMLTALHKTVDLVRNAHGLDIDLALLPQDPAVYDMLCEADSIGVFQVESRAQMATLPRLRPRCFSDLVVEVALIRPGPIQGGSVHPYIRRRNGKEPVTYLHPLLEHSLAKTLGVPLFQEQLMQIAIDVGGFTAAEADRLRQAMGSKRSSERMEQLRSRFFSGATIRGVTDDIAAQIWEKLAAFSSYGFPESHSVSFAYLVYSSSWLKLYFPAAFCAGLLNAQPMGFYSPHSLVQDARRHGVETRTPDINRSGVGVTLEWGERTARVPPPFPTCGVLPPQPAIRLALSSVRGISSDLAEHIVAERDANGAYSSMEDLKRRVDARSARRRPLLTLAHLEALAMAGAFVELSQAASARPLDRRRALWSAGAAAQTGADRLEGIVTGMHAPTLPGMTDQECAVADIWATGIAPDGHPTRFVRTDLNELGIVPAARLRNLEDRAKVLVAGVVTHRQRPATAGGTIFLNLEDETGFVNVICSVGLWTRYATVARNAPALLIRGRIEKIDEGVCNVIAEKLTALTLAATTGLRDFR